MLRREAGRYNFQLCLEASYVIKMKTRSLIAPRIVRDIRARSANPLGPETADFGPNLSLVLSQNPEPRSMSLSPGSQCTTLKK